MDEISQGMASLSIRRLLEAALFASLFDAQGNFLINIILEQAITQNLRPRSQKDTENQLAFRPKLQLSLQLIIFHQSNTNSKHYLRNNFPQQKFDTFQWELSPIEEAPVSPCYSCFRIVPVEAVERIIQKTKSLGVYLYQKGQGPLSIKLWGGRGAGRVFQLWGGRGREGRGLLQILNYIRLNSFKGDISGEVIQGFIIIRMQRQGNMFWEVASRVANSSIFTEILQKQQNVYDVQPYKVQSSQGENMLKIYNKIRNRYEYLTHQESDPDNWNQNQRRLFIWFIICYTHFLQQKQQLITPDTWQRLSPVFFNKKPEFLHFQYLNLLKNKTRVVWTPEEDQLLTQCTLEIKPGKWNAISKKMFYESGQQLFRTPKHCRERWLNHLDQSKKHGEWTHREDLAIFEYALSKGKRWSKMVDLLDGTRTEHMIKNRYNSLVAKWRGAKKQKEEEVARKILSMLSRSSSSPGQTERSHQQKLPCQSQDKKQESLAPSPIKEPQPEQPRLNQAHPHPNFSSSFPFGCYMDYPPFYFYNQFCYGPGLGIYGFQKEGNPVNLQTSKNSSFSTYRTEPRM